MYLCMYVYFYVCTLYLLYLGEGVVMYKAYDNWNNIDHYTQTEKHEIEISEILV